MILTYDNWVDLISRVCFVTIPGTVSSRFDSQFHSISSHQLLTLWFGGLEHLTHNTNFTWISSSEFYGLSLAQGTIVNPESLSNSWGWTYRGRVCIPLRVDYSGDYNLEALILEHALEGTLVKDPPDSTTQLLLHFHDGLDDTFK